MALSSDPTNTSHNPQSGYSPVIFDTNSLMMPFQFKVNIDLELDRLMGFWYGIVPSCVIDELAGLSKTYPHARAARKLAEKYEIVETKAAGDDGVLEAVRKTGGILLTNDKELKKRAITFGSKVIYLRKKKYLVISGE
ncbi:MAG: twitching motility protein PilT [Candidatus Thermoplasmatota archaeon]|jgi:hypothetical protein|nr:twitching motility protein PilT [Candidatus Thermoplasmatota archaeon]MDP7264191.1 twitching motility protein PilT [Candidatus Thermoplasmatota archaeon]